MDLITPLENMRTRYQRVEADLSAPETSANPALLQQLSREHARLAPIVQKFQRYRKELEERAELNRWSQSTDTELQRLAAEELPRITQELASLEAELQL